MRYASMTDILGVISNHPEGITTQDITKALWPERIGIDYTMSYDWTKCYIQILKKKDLIERGGQSGRQYLWKVKA